MTTTGTDKTVPATWPARHEADWLRRRNKEISYYVWAAFLRRSAEVGAKQALAEIEELCGMPAEAVA